MDDKGFSYIKEVTSKLDTWYEAKQAIAGARQIILHKLNLKFYGYPTISKFFLIINRILKVNRGLND